MKTEVLTEHFSAWRGATGQVASHNDGTHECRVYGFDNTEKATEKFHFFETAQQGACYGFVQKGEAVIYDGHVRKKWFLSEGMFFSMPWLCKVELEDSSRVLVVQKCGFLGQYYAGGPIEEKGRLVYIDGCSDTLLIPPPVLGEPCFNHLHFPPNIDQTEHTHPSLRVGIVAKGKGVCVTPTGETKLREGLMFMIPTDGVHKFKTESSSMDVIAFHPDSDCGPTHQNHPMVNRTWVDGSKIDNSQAVHQHENIIKGYK